LDETPHQQGRIRQDQKRMTVEEIESILLVQRATTRYGPGKEIAQFRLHSQEELLNAWRSKGKMGEWLEPRAGKTIQ